MRRKRNRRLWSVLGPVGWRESMCQQLHQGGMFMAQLQQELKSTDNTSHQEPGHLGLKSSTPTEPEIPLAPAVDAQEAHRAQRDHCALPGSPLNTTSCLCQLKCQRFAKPTCCSVGAQTAWVHLSGIGRVWGNFSHILDHWWHVLLALLLRVWMFTPLFFFKDVQAVHFLNCWSP